MTHDPPKRPVFTPRSSTPPPTSEEVIQALMVMAEIYSKTFSRAAAQVLADDLSEYPAQAVLASLSRCRREFRSFPTLADIVARIEDGRPGPEEAWALIPKSEYGSVVWTEEMREAFGVARKLLDHGDEIAARLAFKEAYVKLTSDARAMRKPVRWSPSFGTDSYSRDAAVKEAVEKGRLTAKEAQGLLPDRTPISPKVLQITTDVIQTVPDAAERAAQIRARLQKELKTQRKEDTHEEEDDG